MAYAPEAPRRHSALGIASLVLAVVFGAGLLALIGIAGYMTATTPGGIREDSPTVIVTGLAMFGCAAGNLVGAALGFAGLFQRQRHKLFPILGLVLNVLLVVGLCGLMGIGLAVKNQQAAGRVPFGGSNRATPPAPRIRADSPADAGRSDSGPTRPAPTRTLSDHGHFAACGRWLWVLPSALPDSGSGSVRGEQAGACVYPRFTILPPPIT
jgi:hypothetical protein